VSVSGDTESFQLTRCSTLRPHPAVVGQRTCSWLRPHRQQHRRCSREGAAAKAPTPGADEGAPCCRRCACRPPVVHGCVPWWPASMCRRLWAEKQQRPRGLIASPCLTIQCTISCHLYLTDYRGRTGKNISADPAVSYENTRGELDKTQLQTRWHVTGYTRSRVINS